MGLTDSEIRDYNIDEYEKQFIDKKLDDLVGIVSETEIENQKYIIFEILELFRSCIDDHRQTVAELITPDLINGLVNFIDRSSFYDDFSGYWSRKLVSNDVPEIYNYKNLVHIMYPVLVQEIEGPLKKLLKIIDFILRIDGGESQSWADFEPSNTYITNVVNSTRESSQNSRHIKGIIDGLDPPGHPINIRLIRNAGAHSDYLVLGQGENLVVRFNDREGSFDVAFQEFWKIFSGSVDLVSLLNISIHLGGRRFLEAVNE